MSKIDVLFYGSAGLCALSFLLFAYLVIVQQRHTAPTRAGGGLGDAQAQAFDIRETMEEMGKLVKSFAKAGPIATTALLCVMFALMAVLSSGLVKVES
jgi:hypothetical protein